MSHQMLAILFLLPPMELDVHGRPEAALTKPREVHGGQRLWTSGMCETVSPDGRCSNSSVALRPVATKASFIQKNRAWDYFLNGFCFRLIGYVTCKHVRRC